MLLTLLFFLATLALTSAAMVGCWLLLRRRTLLGRSSWNSGLGEGRANAAAVIDWVEPNRLLKTDSLSTISVWARLLAKVDYVNVMKARLRQAGIRWSVGRLTASMLLAGAVSYACLAHVAGTSFLVSAAGSVGGTLLPYGYVLQARRRRLDRMEDQFSDALDSLARAMRAGNTLAAALEIVASECPEPLAGELRTLVEERRFGRSWEEALDNLVARAPLVEVSIFAAAIKLQNRAGGRLNEVLARLAETLRDSESLRSEVRSIAAHGRFTGRLLTVIPILICALMLTLNPGYFDSFLAHPLGKDLAVAAGMSVAAAHLLIRKLVDISL
ncbi:MAG: type II secretion system F family protein [Bryobacteraceae bacterium]|nr:type II secretion system F family protein [Bryobacteraceae bacterium]